MKLAMRFLVLRHRCFLEILSSEFSSSELQKIFRITKKYVSEVLKYVSEIRHQHWSKKKYFHFFVLWRRPQDPECFGIETSELSTNFLYCSDFDENFTDIFFHDFQLSKPAYFFVKSWKSKIFARNLYFFDSKQFQKNKIKKSGHFWKCGWGELHIVN